MNPLQIGINLDGVLIHDGFATPETPTRLAWIKNSGAFDYIEKNMNPAEDFTPYFEWVEQYGVPIRVFGGIFCAGLDEERMRWGLRTGGKRLGAELFNMQLFARHADGHALSDREVADFFLDAMEVGTASGCLPSMEVHVDMWSERFHRIEAVANMLAQSNVDMRITLDHSHLIFKTDNAAEMAISGIAAGEARNLYTQWLQAGWVVHAHTRSVATGLPGNPLRERSKGVPGRAIQYPFINPGANNFHSEWNEERLQDWKTAVLEMLAHMKKDPQRAPQRISCEFIPFPDYGGGARYSIWDNNLACAAWLRTEWEAIR